MIGVPHKKYQERPLALVRVSGSVSKDELYAFLRDKARGSIAQSHTSAQRAKEGHGYVFAVLTLLTGSKMVASGGHFIRRRNSQDERRQVRQEVATREVRATSPPPRRLQTVNEFRQLKEKKGERIIIRAKSILQELAKTQNSVGIICMKCSPGMLSVLNSSGICVGMMSFTSAKKIDKRNMDKHRAGEVVVLAKCPRKTSILPSAKFIPRKSQLRAAATVKNSWKATSFIDTTMVRQFPGSGPRWWSRERRWRCADTTPCW